jgi:hypothetical protein
MSNPEKAAALSDGSYESDRIAFFSMRAQTSLAAKGADCCGFFYFLFTIFTSQDIAPGA